MTNVQIFNLILFVIQFTFCVVGWNIGNDFLTGWAGAWCVHHIGAVIATNIKI